MIRRLFFAVFFCLGGFLFYIPKWILMGTRGSRQREQLIRLQKQQFAQQQGQRPIWPPPGNAKNRPGRP